MGVITISRQYGSGGLTIGREISKILGYRYINKDLVAEVAREAEIPLAEIERFDECPEPTTTRLSKKILLSPYPSNFSGEMFEEPFGPTVFSQHSNPAYDTPLVMADEDSFVRLTQQVMIRLADRGKAVLIGRGGQALLSGRSDTFHVRILAPFEDRVETVIEEDRVCREEAELLIRRIDRNRKRYLKRHYGIDWNDPTHYHMTINTGRVDTSRAARMVVAAA